MRIVLSAPDPDAFVSGGNIYNGHLADALRDLGVEVEFTNDLIDPGMPGIDHLIIDSIYFNKYKDNPRVIRACGLIHHLNSFYPFSPEKFEREDRPMLDRLDKYIVTSQWTRDFFVRMGFNKEKILELPPVGPSLTRTEFTTVSKPRAIMLNNLVERKGVLEFLISLKEANIPPDYELRIIGSMTADPEYSLACQSTARTDRNLSKTVRFLGEQDDRQVRLLMNKSNLFISASLFETFGMSIQEAAIMGLPLLVLNGGNSINHVSEGENGLTAQSMTELVNKFENMVMAPESLDSLFLSASNYSPDYEKSWDDAAEKLLKFL